MARRRGRGGGGGGGQQQANPETADLGVGGLAGELEHGQRPIVESVAAAGPPQGGGGQPQPGQAQGGQPPGGSPGADQDLFGPTSRPEQPVEAGLPMGPGGTSMVLADDPDMFLRALYEGYPHPDILSLLNSRGA